MQEPNGWEKCFIWNLISNLPGSVLTHRFLKERIPNQNVGIGCAAPVTLAASNAARVSASRINVTWPTD